MSASIAVHVHTSPQPFASCSGVHLLSDGLFHHAAGDREEISWFFFSLRHDAMMPRIESGCHACGNQTDPLPTIESPLSETTIEFTRDARVSRACNALDLDRVQGEIATADAKSAANNLTGWHFRWKRRVVEPLCSLERFQNWCSVASPDREAIQPRVRCGPTNRLSRLKARPFKTV